MGEPGFEKPKKNVSIGLLAHVDAGKTTLSECLLYVGGSIRKMGRVDKGDAFLDTNYIEKARGITIYAKQALLQWGDTQIALLDTPGHVDFSAEMERTIQVLDYAVIVISGADGIQAHTMTVWKLLEQYGVPTVLFVNKMDQPGIDRNTLLYELQKRLSGVIIPFDHKTKDFSESIAMCDEKVLDTYLETGDIDEQMIAGLVSGRKVFPCYFGSALKMQGVREFVEDFQQYIQPKQYPETFGARVYKVTRDDQGNRLTHMKITGGSLAVRTLLTGGEGDESWGEKINQIRIYSGSKYDTAEEVGAGCVCAVTGLTRTYPGQGLGYEEKDNQPILQPVLNYQIILPKGCDPHKMLAYLRELEEEDPLLHIVWDSRYQEIHAQVMGEVQIQILQGEICRRYGIDVQFGQGAILYKETIEEPIEGVGHYEPLRHYAEVHLLMEPGEPGSGLLFDRNCSEDKLNQNWQKLILAHLMEREHIGVLTGSPITDMKVTLIAGRGHLKHTEGGDFRQATYRAVRQGLKKAKSILLEPYYEYRLEIPNEAVGRAMSDIQMLHGEFDTPEAEGKIAVLTGTAPVATMRDYQQEVLGYTKGQGRLFCTLGGYRPCHNSQEVIEQIAYDSESDLEHPTGSVFCAHGAGFQVSWDKVDEYMHIQTGFGKGEEEYQDKRLVRPVDFASIRQSEKELEEIFARTYGAGKNEEKGERRRRISAPVGLSKPRKKQESGEEYLLVDGYNIIFAWEELRVLAEENINAARDKLMDILCNYQGYKKCRLILVFDAYKVKGGTEEVYAYHNIHVVYTKEAETADQYIEKVAHKIGHKYQVTVATSDGLEQLIIRGQGCMLLSAVDLKEEVDYVGKQIQEEYHDKQINSRNYLFDHMSDEMAEYMEDVRLGKREL